MPRDPIHDNAQRIIETTKDLWGVLPSAPSPSRRPNHIGPWMLESTKVLGVHTMQGLESQRGDATQWRGTS